MNASKVVDLATFLAEMERLGAAFDTLLDTMEHASTASEREATIAAIDDVLRARGTVVDGFLAWCASPQGKRTMTAGRRHWQDALDRLHTTDQRRAQQLQTLVQRAGDHLRQRIAQQSLFIYQRSSL